MTQPGSEARISNLEKETINLGARIEEASADTAEELKAIKRDIKELDDDVTGSYKSIGDTFVATWDDIKATLATKEDLAAFEARVNTRFDKVEGVLSEILNRLPKSDPGAEICDQSKRDEWVEQQEEGG